MNKNFFPEGYKNPIGEQKEEEKKKIKENYTSPLPDGETRLRILEGPIMGFVEWNNKKPTRHTMDVNQGQLQQMNDPKHFWGFKVWNYTVGKVQIWEVTQYSIQQELEKYLNIDGWGNPKGYDITIKRTGKDLETRYSFSPIPPAELDPEIKAKATKVYVDFDKWFAGEDPFGFEPASEREAVINENGDTPDISIDDIPEL